MISASAGVLSSIVVQRPIADKNHTKSATKSSKPNQDLLATADRLGNPQPKTTISRIDTRQVERSGKTPSDQTSRLAVTALHAPVSSAIANTKALEQLQRETQAEVRQLQAKVRTALKASQIKPSLAKRLNIILDSCKFNTAHDLHISAKKLRQVVRLLSKVRTSAQVSLK